MDDLPSGFRLFPQNPAFRSLLVPLASDYATSWICKQNPPKHGRQAPLAASAPRQNESHRRLSVPGRRRRAQPRGRTARWSVVWRPQCGVWEPDVESRGPLRCRERWALIPRL